MAQVPSHDLPLPQRRRTPEARSVGAKNVVTLVVYGWHSVQPGVLSWTFPNVRAAVKAARTMRNAERWAVVDGANVDLTRARARGRVLVEA